MKESFCILCHKQEFPTLPNGRMIKHNTPNVEDILCSTCTQFCIAKGIGKTPWEGKEQMQEMLKTKSERKLKTRR